MEGLFIQFNCATCNALESAPTYKQVTQCAKCSIVPVPPKLLSSSRSKFAKRTCLCVFCHSVYIRYKHESGLACFQCRVFLRGNGLRGDLYDDVWCKLETSRCYVCKERSVKLRTIGKTRTCCTHECLSLHVRECKMAILICLKRCGFYKDLRQKICFLVFRK